MNVVRRTYDDEGPRPFLKWAGGKTQLLPELMSRLREASSFGRYHEPFLGGGAVFFEVCRTVPKLSQTYISDNNERLIAAYQGVAEDVEGVIEVLEKHRRNHEEAYYYEIRSSEPASLIERAARIIYLNKTCYNGLYRENSKGVFNVPFGRYTNPQIFDADNLRAVSRTLTGVRIEARAFDTVLECVNAGDFVYFDPPYVPVSKTSYFTSYHRDRFGEAEQRRLAEVIDQLHERGVLFMLSNSDTEFVHTRYAKYNVEVVKAKRNVNSRADGRGEVNELIVRNFPEKSSELSRSKQKVSQVPKKQSIQSLYAFLMDKAKTRKPFTIDEWATNTRHKVTTAKTYISKQLKDYVVRGGGARKEYYVKPQFSRLTRDEFEKLVSQKEQALTEYRRVTFGAFLTFDFLLPLTYETQLRQSLDALFYEDTLQRQIEEIGLPDLKQIVPAKDSETDAQYVRRLLSEISLTFTGYSIFTASGRYLASDLLTRINAAHVRYLIDETTAVVRFMIPCRSTIEESSDGQFNLETVDLSENREILEEVTRVRKLFFAFFVDVVVSTVNGEDQIWLVESGLGQRLYVFKRP